MRRREAELRRQSPDAYRTLVAGLPDIVMRFDREGRHLFVSDNVETAVDIPAADFLGRTHRELGFPEPLCRFWEDAIRTVCESRAPHETEFSFEGRRGRMVFDWRLVPEFDPHGAVASVLSIARDVTAHREAEQALRDTLQTSDDIVRAIPAGLFIYQFVPPDRLILLSSNPEAERLTGIRAEQWQGREFNEIWPQARQTGMAATVLDVARTGVTAETEDFHYTDERLSGVFRVRAFALPNSRLAVAFEDITERRRAEEALRDAMRRLETAVKAGRVGLWDWDLQTNHVVYSAEWKRQIGYEDHEIGHDFEEWRSRVHPEDLPGTLTRIRGFIASEHLDYETEFRLRHRDGSYRHILAQASILRDTDGRAVRVLGSHVDITEAKLAEEEKARLEAQYRHAQKMEAVGQLTGGVAHDFNNLLQVINGGVELALADLSADHPARGSIEDVGRAGERAARLVSQLLLFSRRQVLRPETLELNEVIAELLSMVERLIGEHIRIRWRPAPEPGVLRADRGMIEQAVMNLCLNARDAMPDGGTLTLETAAVTIDKDFCATHAWARPGRYIRLRVVDTGYGMDRDVLERAFEPFFTTKDVGRGTGLGLATVYGIVTQHHGLITADSEPGRGTCFELYWRVSNRSGDAPRAGTDESVGGGVQTLLLAEDDASVRRLAQTILERAGYTVLVASDGVEAAALFDRRYGDIDAAILDVVMPRMGGLEACRRMRRIRPDLKVLFASGYSEETLAADVTAGEGVMLLAKPYVRDDLLRAVRRVLDPSASQRD